MNPTPPPATEQHKRTYWPTIRTTAIVMSILLGGGAGWNGFTTFGDELRGLRTDVQNAQKGQVELKTAMNDLGYDIRDLKRETSMAADGRLRLMVIEIVRQIVKQDALR